MVALFKRGTFIGHAGGQLDWKIDCDALTHRDYECLAERISNKISFRQVFGVPRGGLLFAKALEPYCDVYNDRILIVDDVMTTGKSMIDMRDDIWSAGYECETMGVVIFGRGPSLKDVELSWVHSMFTLSEWVEDDGPNPFPE